MVLILACKHFNMIFICYILKEYFCMFKCKIYLQFCYDFVINNYKLEFHLFFMAVATGQF
jgi:hypothetical protein